MHLFGLFSSKPMAAARINGRRMLPFGQQSGKPASKPVQYLRHASAVSAAIAKNMSSSMLSQQPGELGHQAGGQGEDDHDDSFLDSHNHYSFIAVVALMSLFLVVTISATGLLLAFCRKKNTVFTASTPKSEAGGDSQFELDDIENSDIEMCRGDKGECYYHLSDDYDDDDDDDESDDGERAKESDGLRKGTGRGRQGARRSKTFPQLHQILEPCPGGLGRGGSCSSSESNQTTTSSAIFTPLINHSSTAATNGDAIMFNNNNNNNKRYHQHHHHHQHHPHGFHYSNSSNGGRGHIICHNPRHQQHSSRCPYNFPHYHRFQQHHRQTRNNHIHSGRPNLARLYRHQFPHHDHTYNYSSNSRSGKLHRAHSIHAIPQTGRESTSQPVPHPAGCAVKITVQNMDKFSFETKDDVRLHNTSKSSIDHQNDDLSCTISSSLPSGTNDDDKIIHMFNDEDDNPQVRSSFNNLRLRLEHDPQASFDIRNNNIDTLSTDRTTAQVTVHQPATPHGSIEFDATEITCDPISGVASTSSYGTAGLTETLPVSSSPLQTSPPSTSSWSLPSSTNATTSSEPAKLFRSKRTDEGGQSGTKPVTDATCPDPQLKGSQVQISPDGNTHNTPNLHREGTVTSPQNNKVTGVISPVGAKCGKSTSRINTSSSSSSMSSKTSSAFSATPLSSSTSSAISSTSSSSSRTSHKPSTNTTVPVPIPPPPKFQAKREPTRVVQRGITASRFHPTTTTTVAIATGRKTATATAGKRKTAPTAAETAAKAATPPQSREISGGDGSPRNDNQAPQSATGNSFPLGSVTGGLPGATDNLSQARQTAQAPVPAHHLLDFSAPAELGRPPDSDGLATDRLLSDVVRPGTEPRQDSGSRTVRLGDPPQAADQEDNDNGDDEEDEDADDQTTALLK